MLTVMFTVSFHVPRQGLLVMNVMMAWWVLVEFILQPTSPELQVYLLLKIVRDAHKLHGSSHGWPSHAA